METIRHIEQALESLRQGDPQSAEESLSQALVEAHEDCVAMLQSAIAALRHHDYATAVEAIKSALEELKAYAYGEPEEEAKREEYPEPPKGKKAKKDDEEYGYPEYGYPEYGYAEPEEKPRGKRGRAKESYACPCKDECPYEHAEPVLEAEQGYQIIYEAAVGDIREAAGENIYEVTLLRSGVSRNRNYWPPELVRSIADLFNGVKAYADHPTKTEAAERPERSIRDIVGWYEGVRWQPGPTGGMLVGRLHLLSGPIADMVREAHARGKPDLIQLSVNVSGRRRPRMMEGMMVQEVEEISRVHSVDLVTEASAGGSIDRILMSVREETERLAALERASDEELMAAARGRGLIDNLHETGSQDQSISETLQEDREEEGTDMAEEQKIQEALELAGSLKEELSRIREELALERKARELEQKLAQSDLPQRARDAIRARFEGRLYESEELDRAIEEQREILAEFRSSRPETVPWHQPVHADVDRYMLAMEGLLLGRPVEDRNGNKVEPFKSLRHAYSVITGTSVFDMTGHEVLKEAAGYDSGVGNSLVGRFQEATAMTSSNFAKILGDSITRVALREYRYPALNEWRRIAHITNVSDLRQQRRLRLGEFTLVENTTENAAYPDLSANPLPEQEAIYTPKKWGGSASLTLEAIINDDLGLLRSIPRKLGRAAAGRIYMRVFNLLKDNPAENTFLSGGDANKRLFEDSATRAPGNLVNDVASTNASVVALNDANLEDAKRIFRLQQAATTGIANKDTMSFILAEPRYLIVAPKNEHTAKRLLMADVMFATGFTNTRQVEPNVNIHRGSLELIVVPYWESAANVVVGSNTLAPRNMWFVMASPEDVPVIEVGFLNGREEPEIFVQEQPTVGDVFTYDRITWKVRHFWEANIVDVRGVVGATVS